MKYKEVKEYYESGKLMWHTFEGECSKRQGENRDYHENGQLWWHNFTINGLYHGEAKSFDGDGTLYHHFLKEGSNILAAVNRYGKPATHTEEQLIQIAKEHNLPLLSELPKAEAEVTHWNLKNPDLPCLPITTT